MDNYPVFSVDDSFLKPLGLELFHDCAMEAPCLYANGKAPQLSRITIQMSSPIQGI